MEPQSSRARAALTVFLAIAALAAATFVHAQVKVRVGNVDIRDFSSTTNTTTTVTGPQGTRSISSQGTDRARVLPGYTTSSGEQDVQVGGAANTGLTVEQRVYYVPQPGQKPGVVGAVPISEGEGTIHRSYETETRSLPPAQIQVGR
jgi:hypothetical protein